jgi:HEAT repeat protein
MLKDRGSAPTAEMLDLLARARGPELVDVLTEHWAAVESGWDTREAAFNALAKHASTSAISFLAARITQHPELAWRALEHIGEAAAPFVVDVFTRNHAIRSRDGAHLAHVARLAAARVLMDAVQDPLRSVRESAERGLVVLGSAVVDDLIDLLRTSQGFGRLEAINALGQIGDSRAESVDIGAHSIHQTFTEQRAALQSLPATCATPVALSRLSEVASNAHWLYENASARSAGRMDDITAVGLLERLAGDRDEQVRSQAIESFGHLWWRTR